MAQWVFTTHWVEVDRHEGLHSWHLLAEEAEEEEEEEGLTLLSGRDGRAEEVEGEAGEAGTLRVPLWKYIVISVWRFCFFISLKTFLCVISPPSTICFCFRAHIIEGSMPYKSQKQSWELRTLLPDCVMSVCFLALLLLGLLPHHPALVRNHSSPSSLFC